MNLDYFFMSSNINSQYVLTLLLSMNDFPHKVGCLYIFIPFMHLRIRYIYNIYNIKNARFELCHFVLAKIIIRNLERTFSFSENFRCKNTQRRKGWLSHSNCGKVRRTSFNILVGTNTSWLV